MCILRGHLGSMVPISDGLKKCHASGVWAGVTRALQRLAMDHEDQSHGPAVERFREYLLLLARAYLGGQLRGKLCQARPISSSIADSPHFPPAAILLRDFMACERNHRAPGLDHTYHSGEPALIEL